jgi:HK97 family phage major capsid protein
MPPAIMTIRDEMRAAHQRIRAIVERARLAERDFTDEERRETDALTARLETLAAKVHREDDFNSLLSHIGARANGAGVVPDRMASGTPWNAGGGESLGAQLVRSEAFAGMMLQIGGGSPARMIPTDFEMRAAVLTPPAGGYPPTTATPPFPVQGPSWGLRTVADLFSVIPVSTGGNVPYLRDPVGATAADLVAPGAAKPETTLAPVLIQDPLAKIAHWTGVANEALEDVAGFAAWVDSILVRGVLDREDQYLVATLLATPGLTPDYPMGAGQNAADAILAAAMAVQAAGRLPVDGVILAPDVFALISTAKADGGGSYLSGAPISAAPALNLWGLAMVVSSSLAAGTAIVGAFRRGAAIYRKRSVRVDMSQDHASFFVQNLTAIRAEVRELLAVYTPKAFGEVTGLVAG